MSHRENGEKSPIKHKPYDPFRDGVGARKGEGAEYDLAKRIMERDPGRLKK